MHHWPLQEAELAFAERQEKIPTYAGIMIGFDLKAGQVIAGVGLLAVVFSAINTMPAELRRLSFTNPFSRLPSAS